MRRILFSSLLPVISAAVLGVFFVSPASGAESSANAFLESVTGPTPLLSKAAVACWSPDGTKVVYARMPAGSIGARGISILEMDGSGKTRELTESGKDPAWSPDGKWIAFVKESGDGSNARDIRTLNESIWLVDADGRTEPRLLTKGAWPFWSPDSEALLFHSREDYGLYRIGIDGESSAERIIVELGYPFPAISPDGRQAAYITQEMRNVVVRPIDGEEERKLPMPVRLRGFLGRWSPDQNWIACGGFLGTGVGLWVVDATGNREPESFLVGNWSHPAWSPDGRFLVYNSAVPGDLNLWILNVDETRVLLEK